MRIANEIAIRCVTSATNDREPESELLLDCRATGKIITGACLEAAVRWSSCYLLFLTDNIAYEEFLRILLLDDQLNRIDSAQIGTPYSTGSFESLKLIGTNRVSFRFMGETPWTVDLLDKPGLRLPLVSEPRGVWRGLRFKRRFIVARNPTPETPENDRT
jgi:hypothetical protein